MKTPTQDWADAPKKTTVSYDVPEGGVPELLAYIEQLDEQLHELLSQAESLDAVKAEAQKNLEAQAAAADKILAQNPQEEARAEAVSAKARALQAKFQMQVPGAEDKLVELLQELKNDPNEQVQQLAVVYELTIPLTKLKTGEVEDSEPVLKGLEEFLTNLKNLDASAFGYGVETIRTFQMLGRFDEMIASMRSVGQAFQESPNNRVALQALALTQQAGQYLEFSGDVEEAQQVYASLQEKVDTLQDPDIKEQLTESLTNARKRTGLVGKELKVENMNNLEGQPLDWAKFQGKVVLLDFWATWCGPCIAEIPNIEEVYAAYKDQGFEVIGVNLDDDSASVEKFFEQQKLPWDIAIPADPMQRGFENPLAVRCGVDAIPFMLLLDQTGKVAAIHTRGPRLEAEVRRLLNISANGEASAPAEQPANEPQSTDEAPAANETPTPENPSQTTPQESDAETGPDLDLPLESPQGDAAAPTQPANEDGALRIPTSQLEFFVYFADDATDEASPAESPSPTPTLNPYRAAADLSTFELVEFLQDMQEKPQVIQQRPGFVEAIVDAADRILADPGASEKFQVLAILTKLQYLHDRASFGDEKADAALAAFVDQIKEDSREKVAREVRFLQLERRTLKADQLDREQIEKLLAEVKSYLEEHKSNLTAKHLRLASATVGAINQLEDGDKREQYFHEFGALFAASQDKELARYGKRLAKETPASSLVGKLLELEGLTELGAPLNWQAYRGKVVVVDFWATWCGPCRRAAPAVKAFLEAHRESGFDVVGVNLDDDHEALTQYLDENQIPWSNIVGDGGKQLAEKYNVRAIPTFILVDRNGKVREIDHSFDALQPKIEELLKAS